MCGAYRFNKTGWNQKITFQFVRIFFGFYARSSSLGVFYYRLIGACMCVCVCVCVFMGERERWRKRERARACVCSLYMRNRTQGNQFRVVLQFVRNFPDFTHEASPLFAFLSFVQ